MVRRLLGLELELETKLGWPERREQQVLVLVLGSQPLVPVLDAQRRVEQQT